MNIRTPIVNARPSRDEAEAALDRRTAEVEASNFRHGELVAERAALRRELEGQTDRVEELEAKLMITKQRASVLEDLARAYGAPIPK